MELNIYIYHFLSVLDISIVSVVLYYIYKTLIDTQAVQIIKGFFTFLFIYGMSYFFNLRLLKWLLNMLYPVFAIALAITLQPELRKLVINLGQGYSFKRKQNNDKECIDIAISSAKILASFKRGALIVFSKSTGHKSIIDTGININSDVTEDLLVTIFKYNTPLHDGAIIIKDNKIIAAKCVLPLSEQRDIKQNFGTRHRAAIGITETSDCIVLVVSEESGAISIAYSSVIYYDLEEQELKNHMYSLLN